MREALALFDAREPLPAGSGTIERPPVGPARGVIPAPSLAVLAVTVALVLLTLGNYALRLRKPRNR
jgi:hypothetical protein